MTQVCRTCLEEVFEVDCVGLNNPSFKLKEELRGCLPEMDVELVPDAVMCIYCINALHSAYDFKQKCLSTEKQILTQLHSLATIDLTELKKAFDVQPTDNHVEMVVLNLDTQEDDDDETYSDNLILGLCESAPRKVTKPPVISLPTGARKSTTKSALAISKRSELIKCYLCKHSMKSVLDYIVHLKNSHKESSYKCPKCAFRTKAPKILMKHHEQHKASTLKVGLTVKCPHCNFETKDEKTLSNHIDGHIFKCTKCFYVATNHANYQMHLKSHISVSNSDDVVIIEDEDETKCDHCTYSSKITSEFEKHCWDVHKIKYPHICKICGYTAGSKSSLIRHSLFHTGNRLYRCRVCTYNCDLIYNLNKHLASRHNLKGLQT